VCYNVDNVLRPNPTTAAGDSVISGQAAMIQDLFNADFSYSLSYSQIFDNIEMSTVTQNDLHRVMSLVANTMRFNAISKSP